MLMLFVGATLYTMCGIVVYHTGRVTVERAATHACRRRVTGVPLREGRVGYTQDFEVDTIEVWEVSPPPVLPEVAGADGSVLDRFKEDRAVLQMAGRGGFSDGVR